LKWFRLAALQGDADAQYVLGDMYKNGLGGPQDYEEAVKWYRKSANQGWAEGLALLGTAYATEKGVPVDQSQAAKLFRLAAELGNALAQTSLGYIYASGGGGLRQDNVQAYIWLGLASAQGNERARETRDKVAKKMAAADISQARRLVRDWYEEHGE
jgi:TPR repeat protein